MIFNYGQYKYKLVFRYNDRATYALLYGEQFLLTKGSWVECYKAKAIRSPKDQDEKAMGRLIAFKRLVDLVPNPELKKELNRCFYSHCKLPRKKLDRQQLTYQTPMGRIPADFYRVVNLDH